MYACTLAKGENYSLQLKTDKSIIKIRDHKVKLSKNMDLLMNQQRTDTFQWCKKMNLKP